MIGLKMEKRKKQKKNKEKTEILKKWIFGRNKILFYCNDVMY